MRKKTLESIESASFSKVSKYELKIRHKKSGVSKA